MKPRKIEKLKQTGIFEIRQFGKLDNLEKMCSFENKQGESASSPKTRRFLPNLSILNSASFISVYQGFYRRFPKVCFVRASDVVVSFPSWVIWLNGTRDLSQLYQDFVLRGRECPSFDAAAEKHS